MRLVTFEPGLGGIRFLGPNNCTTGSASMEGTTPGVVPATLLEDDADDDDDDDDKEEEGRGGRG